MSPTLPYRSAGVEVTAEEARIGGTIYSVAQMASVSLETSPANTGCLWLFVWTGIPISLIAGVLTFTTMSERAITGQEEWAAWAILTACGIGAVLLANNAINTAKPTCVVRLAVSSGEVEALVTREKPAAEALVAALREAMRQYAAGSPPERPAAVADVAQAQSANDSTKECPQCAETVKARAKICRFCRHEFD